MSADLRVVEDVDERCKVGSATNHPCRRVAEHTGMCAKHDKASYISEDIDETNEAGAWLGMF